MVKQKRGTTSLRKVIKEIDGISASTICRIESGREPDVESFIRVCRWLDVPMDFFVKGR